MIFSEEDIAKILTGEKTVTRLPGEVQPHWEVPPLQISSRRRLEGGLRASARAQEGVQTASENASRLPTEGQEHPASIAGRCN